MTAYEFTGPESRVYPDLKDEDGAVVGPVEPGDTRNLAGAPDHRWRGAEPAKAKADSKAKDGDGGDDAKPAGGKTAAKNPDQAAGKTGTSKE